MFCPQCHVEYRPGFTHCTDCDVDLVEALPTEQGYSKEENPTSPDLSNTSLEKVWEGDDQASCVCVCKRLRDSNMPYQVRERNQQVYWSREQHFVILVAPSDAEAALKICNGGTLDFTDSEEDQAIMGIPAQDDLPAQEVHGDWQPKDWFPEDATQEIWSSDKKNYGWMIEMSLKENRINWRMEMQNNMPARIFVLPEDEERAREIVREIVEGAPPE